MGKKDNRIYRTVNHGTRMPRTKAEFAAMLINEYGYGEKLADDCAAIVAGHGAFDFPPEAYETARAEMLDGWDEGTEGLKKAVKANRKHLGLPPAVAVMTLSVAARTLLATLQRHGDWDDGCFYYSGKSAPELQKPMQDLADMIEKENASRESGDK